MKKLIIIIVTLFCINNAKAQSHTFMPGWCKLAKSSGRSALSESAIHVCQVCNAKDKKEKDAKLVEDNRRVKVASDKYKADKLASENARLEKIRLEKEEVKRIKDIEASDAIARDEMMKKYKEIAEKGRIKSNVKDISAVVPIEYNTDKIIPFLDKKRKVYGFIIDNVEVLILPLEDSRSSYFDRVEKTNYFELSVFKDDGSSFASIINKFGKKIKFNGIDVFLNLIKNPYKNIFYVNMLIPNGYPAILSSKYCRGNSESVGINLFKSAEAVEAYLESTSNESCFGPKDYNIFNVTQYQLDENFKVIEYSDGYVAKVQNKY